MKTLFFLSLTFILLISPIFAVDSNNWISIATPNFLIFSDGTDADARRVGLKFEIFRQTLRQTFALTNANIDEKIIVILFKNKTTAQNFQPPTINKSVVSNNYFWPGETSNYIILSLENESDEIYKFVFRDYAKYLLNKNYGETNVPLWLKEGLPDYFQTFRLKNNQAAAFGALQPAQLQLLRNSRLLSLNDLFNFDYNQWQSLNNDEKSLFKLQALAFVRYLNQNSINQQPQQLSNFLKAFAIDKKSEEFLKQTFQTDLATLQKEFGQFLTQNSFQETSATLGNNQMFDAAKWSVDLISKALINAILGDLLTQINRPNEAQKLLEQSVAENDQSAFAHASLGLALVKERDFAAGLKEIEKAVSLAPRNHLWHYFYAVALAREETDKTGFVRNFSKEKAAKIRAALARSIELNSSFSPAYHLSANVNFVNNEDLDGAHEFIDQALKISPGNPEYALEKAQIYLRQEKFDEAQKLADRVLKTTDFPAGRTKARVLLTSISSIREELKRMQNISPNQNKNAAPQIEMSQEEALNQALNEALRKPLSGEKRAAVYLTTIDCNDDNIIFMAHPDNSNQILRFGAAEFKKVIFRTFAPGIEGNQISCGARNVENFAIITYRAPSDTKSKFNGEIVALEFVPPEFKLKQ